MAQTKSDAVRTTGEQHVPPWVARMPALLYLRHCRLIPTPPAPHRTHKGLEQMSAEQTQGRWLGKQRNIWSALEREKDGQRKSLGGVAWPCKSREPHLHE